VPVDILNEAPLYRLRARKPEWLSRLQARNPGSVPDISPGKCGPFLLRLLASPNIASKEWVFRQYDHQVGTNTVVPPGNDGAVLRIKGTQKALVLASDGNGRQCYLDPYQGGAMVVAEAARNVVCMGARPLAITDCLNFGSPEREDIYYQLKESIRGLARACRVLGVPVISGNVSLYNETLGQAIYPTPVVGMVGLVEDIDRVCTMGFRSGGDIVLLLGGSPGPGSVDGLAGSEYMEMAHGLVVGRPDIDLGLEKRLQRLCLRAIRRGLIRSAHDCSDGGLAVTLAESSIAGGIGFRGEEGVVGERIDSSLFGEKPSRIVVSVVPGDVARLGEMAVKAKVSMRWLGAVGGDRFFVPGCVDLALEELDRAWRGGLQRELGQAK
jgi:phosphoribosylformylglycinamidine synthase